VDSDAGAVVAGVVTGGAAVTTRDSVFVCVSVTVAPGWVPDRVAAAASVVAGAAVEDSRLNELPVSAVESAAAPPPPPQAARPKPSSAAANAPRNVFISCPIEAAVVPRRVIRCG
jgi:hypothetical protein